jgi:hypothetical protein
VPLRTTSRRALPALVLLICLGAATRAGAAEPTKEECLDSYKKNQQLRREGALRESIKQLLVCARDPCPSVLQPDCIDWLRDANARLPSIVVKAHAGDASDLTDVSVTFDGVPLVGRLDGRAIDVDPGAHTLVFTRPGSSATEKKLLFVEGEKGRVVDVDFTRTAANAPVPRESDASAALRPVPWTVYVLGGLGLAALGTGATFGTIGLAGRSDLRTCSGPRCPDDKDAVARKFLVADISFAVGAASVVAATILYLTRPSKTAPASSSAP